MGDKLKAAAVGGGALFVLALVTFFVPVRPLRLCCCLWSVGGGTLAAYLYIRKSPTPVRTGAGAQLGALAGLIGGLPLITVFVLMLFGARERLQAEVEARMFQMGYSTAELSLSVPALLALAGVMIFGAVFVLSTVGGLIGVPLFEKRKGEGAGVPPPPPLTPPDFGSTPGAGGGFGAGT